MSTNNEQNGRQPPLPNRPPPSDPRAGNVSERPLCRKYVWGTCTKGINCKFRHDLELEEMKKILKFCHDFQNKQGCGRVECTYLHASKEQENLFRNNNQIPHVLLERYAALAEASNSMQNFEGVPQMMMFVTAPPPPPPPPAQMLPAAAAPPPPPPQVTPTFPTIHQPPPPPPPPPTVSATAVAQSPAVFSGPPLQGAPVMFPMSQPPPQLPPLFDASRPPPPIPIQTKSASKRRMECEAGPSKVRKAEVSKAEACENCVQREIRISVYKQELEKITCELKYQSLVYKKKLNEYENGREILRSLVSSDMFRILDEYVEGGPPQMQDILAQISTTPIMSLLEYLFSGGRNVDSTLTPSLRLDDTLSSLSSLSRITNPISHPSPDLLHSLIEVFRKTNTERETRTETEVRTSTPGSSSVNGFNRFANGQLVEVSSSTASIASSSRHAVASSSSVSRTYPSPGAAGPSNAKPAGPAPAPVPAPVPPPPAPAYPPYHPGIPPPTNRPYYNQSYSGPASSSSSMVSMQYHSSRAGPPQMIARPPAPPTTPSMPPGYSQYIMGRYPQSHPPQYYPPYQ